MKKTLYIALFSSFISYNSSFFAQENTSPVPENNTVAKKDESQIAKPQTINKNTIILNSSIEAKKKFDKHKETFSISIEKYKLEKIENKKKFDALIESYNSDGVDYLSFQKKWRTLATTALNFPDSLPIYKELSELIEKASDLELKQDEPLQDLRNQYYQLIEEDRHHIYLQLKKLNWLRSIVLKDNLSQKKLSLFGKHSGAAEDIQLEIRLVSYQFKSLLAQKFSLLKKNFYGGFWGMTEIVKEIFILLFVFSLPFIFYSLFLKFSQYLEIQQKELFRKGYREPNYRLIAKWIQRTNPFLPWIFIIVLIKICEKLLLSTNIYEFFIMFSPYVSLYATYRIFRILIELSLTKVLQSIGATNKGELRSRLVSTSKFIGMYFFWLFCILHSVENAVNKGLIFVQVQAFSYWVSFFILSFAFSKWKNEISDYVSHINSHFVFKKFSEFCKGRLNILFCFPAVILIIVHILLMWVYSWLKRFEFIKKLSLKILRVRLESSQKTLKSQAINIPEDYIENFQKYFEFDEERWVGANTDFAQKIMTEITEWHKGLDDENTLAISGERGTGKTYLMKHLMTLCQKGSIDATYLSIDRKLTTSSSIENFIKEQLNIKTSKNQAKLEGENEDSATQKKRVIFIDNIQNLFLAKLNGFDALNSFMHIISSNYKNFYWCCSLTDQSWIYLNCVSDSTHYFRSHLKMPKWSDKALQNLILGAHKQTGYKHNFDKILFAASPGAMNETFNIEERFFQLLWEQSEGNPLVAQKLWISSIIGVYNKHFKIGLPKDVDIQNTDSLSQNMLFIFAATFRHENLSIKEASEATNIPLGLVRQAYKRGLEEGMIESNLSGRYKISIHWTHSLLKLLKRKNYLYGTTKN